jgi:hypothetical protein
MDERQPMYIVTGGRDYGDRAAAFARLDALPRPVLLMQGECPTGADRWAREWCSERGVPCVGVHALWKADGRGAGPKRNGRMLWLAQTLADRLLPDECRLEVVAFPGGDGTADCVRQAEGRGIGVRDGR